MDISIKEHNDLFYFFRKEKQVNIEDLFLEVFANSKYKNDGNNKSRHANNKKKIISKNKISPNFYQILEEVILRNKKIKYKELLLEINIIKERAKQFEKTITRIRIKKLELMKLLLH